jgi:hypothetical protein
MRVSANESIGVLCNKLKTDGDAGQLLSVLTVSGAQSTCNPKDSDQYGSIGAISSAKAPYRRRAFRKVTGHHSRVKLREIS